MINDKSPCPILKVDIKNLKAKTACLYFTYDTVFYLQAIKLDSEKTANLVLYQECSMLAC